MKNALRYAAAYSIGGFIILYALMIGLPLTGLIRLSEISANGLLTFAKKVEKVRRILSRGGTKMLRFAQKIHPRGRI